MDARNILAALRAPRVIRSRRLDPTGRALVMTMIALAVLVIVSLIWSSGVNPDPGPSPVLDGGPASPLGAGLADWLLLAACGGAGLAGIAMLTLDLQARKLARHRSPRRLR